MQRFVLFMEIKVSLGVVLLIATVSATAETAVGPWVPIFKGIDHSVSTNIPSGGDFANRQVVHAFRVDLADSDIRPPAHDTASRGLRSQRPRNRRFDRQRFLENQSPASGDQRQLL